MSLNSLADLSNDVDFQRRVAAAYSIAVPESAQNPLAWANENQWRVSASPGFADAYESAQAGGVERPGRDPAVITDPQIEAAVQAITGVT